jgi:hypothetical protein
METLAGLGKAYPSSREEGKKLNRVTPKPGFT